MQVYNAEFFTRQYEFICNRNFSELVYSFDYVSPDSNSFIVENIQGVSEGDFVQISGGAKNIYGIVNHIDEKESLSEVFIDQMTALFDTHIVFDTDLQGGTKSLETVISDFVRSLYVSNQDALQNISGITIQTTSNTTDWGFNLKSTYEGMHTLIINMWKSLLSRALVKYRVVIDVVPNFAEKTLTITIGRRSYPERVIETNLPNVIDRSIIVGQRDNNYNKLTVYNGQNYNQTVVYYLHPDGTYNTTNINRITPVSQEIKDVDTSNGGNFYTMASSQANEVFGGALINNNITMELFNDDTLVNPLDMEIGQEVTVLSDGNAYKSMLTGFSFGTTATLVFGTVRQELTKIL